MITINKTSYNHRHHYPHTLATECIWVYYRTSYAHSSLLTHIVTNLHYLISSWSEIVSKKNSMVTPNKLKSLIPMEKCWTLQGTWGRHKLWIKSCKRQLKRFFFVLKIIFLIWCIKYSSNITIKITFSFDFCVVNFCIILSFYFLVICLFKCLQFGLSKI